ncbi:glycosyltransferase family 2 protein [Glaciihabitans arcticus]|uniref:Glycosyltransferase family 2 protein n=1 Tax=Glaciihabitans arcticus TaxID=2668039 RepID=A0A4Q9GSI9_9MICO|nr:glycosyltransferase family A protein [Glaciihabitans arcticus]TBN57986.1 glycosyltransferase family 2 protein [Glaciihabitans arcticus]
MTAPSVGVVIATRGRPELLRSAVRAALAQDYDGEIEVIVVFDQVPIDALDDIAVPGHRRFLRTIHNERTPGLAGGRNTGILATSAELVAFCDDDDEWLPTKLRRQGEEWEKNPDAVLVSVGITILTEGAEHVRLPPVHTVFADLLESRITEIHPSTFLLRRSSLLGEVGLVDEQLPFSYGEDYDLLLRAARTGPILGVPEPLVVIRWNRVSFFSDRWQGIADGLTYILAKYPEFASTAIGSARLEGQIAFAYAALGDRPTARHWARRTIRHDRSQLRGWAALAISARLVPASFLVAAVNRRGRGL